MKHPTDRHYPLGFVEGAAEVSENFGPEAEAIGIITILWNRLELLLGEAFETALHPRAAFAEALWEAENTHRGRIKLLRIVLETIELPANASALLSEVLDRMQKLSETRNNLAHGEYVVDIRDEALFARTRRRSKPPTYRRTDLEALNVVIAELQQAEALCAALSLALLPPGMLDEISKEILAAARSTRSGQSPGRVRPE